MNVDAPHVSHKPNTPQAVIILMQQGRDKEGIMNWDLGVYASASKI